MQIDCKEDWMHSQIFEEKFHKRNEHQRENSSTNHEKVSSMSAFQNETMTESYSGQQKGKT